MFHLRKFFVLVIRWIFSVGQGATLFGEKNKKVRCEEWWLIFCIFYLFSLRGLHGCMGNINLYPAARQLLRFILIAIYTLEYCLFKYFKYLVLEIIFKTLYFKYLDLKYFTQLWYVCMYVCMYQSWAVIQVYGYLFGISSTEYLKKWCISSTGVFKIPVFPVLPVLFFLVFKKKF